MIFGRTTYPVQRLPVVIPIGVQTETGVEEIGFEVSAWTKKWPDMEVTVWHRLPGQADAYLCKSRREGDILYWEVTDTDTQTPGTGRVELMGTTATGRKLSGNTATRIRDTIAATTQDPPLAPPTWVETVQEMLSDEKISSAIEKYLAEHPFDGVTAEELAESVNAALLVAKESGEFDGAQGPQGPKGDRGEQGIQGPKGDAGPAGANGKDGAQGPAGKDGVSVTHAWSGTTLSVTSASGTTSADLKGPKGDTGATGAAGAKGDKGDAGAVGPIGPAGPKGDTGLTGPAGAKGDKGDTGATGAKGADGVSPTVTVSKSGKVTTVTIKDAAGTKTATINDGADGANGATGATGPTGPAGAAGKTPVKGTDYWTTADKQSIVNDVLAALPAAEGVSF